MLDDGAHISCPSTQSLVLLDKRPVSSDDQTSAQRTIQPDTSEEEGDHVTGGVRIGRDDEAVDSKCRMRTCVGKAPPERVLNPARVSSLEKTPREFPTRSTGEVIVPENGLSFDSIAEAYDFYNLYSWEKDFGIRYGKSRLNVDSVKCMQEIVCGCSTNVEQWKLRYRTCCRHNSSLVQMARYPESQGASRWVVREEQFIQG